MTRPPTPGAVFERKPDWAGIARVLDSWKERRAEQCRKFERDQLAYVLAQRREFRTKREMMATRDQYGMAYTSRTQVGTWAVYFATSIDLRAVEAMGQKAAKNKSGICRSGPVVVKITERGEVNELTSYVGQLSARAVKTAKAEEKEVRT